MNMEKKHNEFEALRKIVKASQEAGAKTYLKKVYAHKGIDEYRLFVDFEQSVAVNIWTDDKEIVEMLSELLEN